MNENNGSPIGGPACFECGAHWTNVHYEHCPTLRRPSVSAEPSPSTDGPREVMRSDVHLRQRERILRPAPETSASTGAAHLTNAEAGRPAEAVVTGSQPQEWGVTQTITGDNGNCLEAAIATVVGLKCEDFPLDLLGHPSAHDDWWTRLANWLAERGWRMGEAVGDAPSGLHVAVGPSPRKPGSHAVVALNGVLVFDPHPTRAFFGGAPVKYFITLDRASSSSSPTLSLRKQT